MNGRRPARIDEYEGEGFAEVISSHGGRKECNGVVYFDDVASGMSLSASQEGTHEFSGTVYVGGSSRKATFPVIMTNIEVTGGQTAVSFTATGNPFASSQSDPSENTEEESGT